MCGTALWIVRNVFTDGEGSLRAKYDAAVREIRSDAPAARTAPLAAQATQRAAAARVHCASPPISPRRISRRRRKAKDYIRAGDIFQVVLSQRFSAKTHRRSVSTFIASCACSILRPTCTFCS